MSIIEQLLRIIAPHHCLGCNKEGYILCAACARGLPVPAALCYRCGAGADGNLCLPCRKVAGVAGVLSVTSYSGLAKEVVHQLKFERTSGAAADIAHALAARFALSEYGSIVTYVPTASVRIRTRGYDQAALIARATAREVGLPFYSILGRSSNNRQVGKDRAVRKQQMQGAFYARKPRTIANRDVLLVDDVITTGSTCEAAAAQLIKAGARHVTLLTFALAPRPGTRQNKKPAT